MSGLEKMEKNLEELKKEEHEIVEEMVNVKMELNRMDSSEKTEEIKEKKVQLFDLDEKRAKCVEKWRKLESEIAEWNREAGLLRERLLKEDGLKMENASSLFQNKVNTADSSRLDHGNVHGDKNGYIPHTESSS